MSKKPNMLSQQYREWIQNERTRIVHGQNKVILPRLPAEEGNQHPHPRRSLRKKDQEPQTLPIDQFSIPESARYRHKAESRVNTSRTLQSGDSRQDSRQMREEKGEVLREMKGWIKTVEAAGNEGTGLQEGTLGKLENALYKWSLFIEQTFSCYQKLQQNLGIYRTPTGNRKKHWNPEDAPPTPGQSQELQASFKEQRELYEREIRRLSMRVQQVEQQLETNRINSLQSLQRVAEVERLFKEWSGKAKRDISHQREQTILVDALLEKNEQFLQELRKTLVQGKETASFVQKIEEKLKIFNQFKARRQDDDEQRAKGFYL